MHLIACTNNAARIGFDPFIEHNAEIIILRAHAEPATPQTKAREINIDLTPDAKEFLLSNLLERTTYSVTIYAITEEYLAENHCRDVSQLPKKLKPSDWLSHKSFEFMSAGCEPPSILEILTATSDYIALRWEGAKAFGSSEYFGQALRWKMEQGEEQQMELSRDATNARIPGILPSGLYKITLDSVFSIKINLDESNDETGRREIRLSTSKMVPVRYTVPNNCEKSEIYLTGYTSKTLDLTWTRPHLFTVSDHPEKIGEQMKIHRRLIGYRIDVNGQKRDELAIDQDRCTLTQCLPDQEYRVQLTTETVVNDGTTNENVSGMTSLDIFTLHETPFFLKHRQRRTMEIPPNRKRRPRTC